MRKYTPLLSKIKKDIDRAKVVSFDVFDTLLLRPYLRPTDLFLHIEKVKQASCFAYVRIGADWEARRKAKAREDITFDEIYNEIDDQFKPLKEVELDWEMRVLSQNPEMKQVWDYAKSQNKKIIVVSDVFLPTDFIAKVLKKNGFGNYDKLYVSGELGKTKYMGTMYRHILADLKIAPKDILHIGDNPHADYKRAKENKIRAVKYKKVIEQFKNYSPRIKDFYKRNSDDLGTSILTSVMAMRWQKQMLEAGKKGDYFKEIGYEYAGPIAYGYTRWVEAKAKAKAKDKGLNTLLFVARDGYTLQKIFDTFNSNIKTSYVYAPRFLNLICRLDYDYRRKEILEHDAVKKSQTTSIIDYFSKFDPQIKKLATNLNRKNWKELHSFIQDNKNLFIKHANKEKEKYKDYLSKIVKPDSAKIGMVDLITGDFSSQKLLQAMLNKQIQGFYWSVVKKESVQPQMQMEQYAPVYGDATVDREKCFSHGWDFVEFLITAPEFPVKRIENGKPVYDDNPSEAENKRKELYPDVSFGAVEFANDINRIFGGADIFLKSSELIRWINAFWDNPTRRDMIETAQIMYAPFSDHKKYVPLFGDPKVPFWKRGVLKKLRWHTKLQKFGLILMSPIKIRLHGLKHLEIHVLPKLKKQIFVWRIRFTDKCFYEIIVGKEKI